MMADWDAYTAGIDELRNAAQAMLDDAVGRCNWSTRAAADLSLEYLQGVYEYVYSLLGDAAEVMIDEWLMQIAASEGISLDKLEQNLDKNDKAKDYAKKAIERTRERINKGDVAGAVSVVKDDLDARLSWKARVDTQRLAQNRTGTRNGKRFKVLWEFAWIPNGAETCAFCITLASRGWVTTTHYIKDFTHHVHGKCDCKLAARPVGGSGWEAYDDGKAYLDAYLDAKKGTKNSRQAINNLRTTMYKDDEELRDKIRAQHRETYRQRQRGKELLEQWKQKESGEQ